MTLDYNLFETEATVTIRLELNELDLRDLFSKIGIIDMFLKKES